MSSLEEVAQGIPRSSLVRKPTHRAESRSYRALGWDKPRSQDDRYLAEQRQGRRAIFFTLIRGYLTLLSTRLSTGARIIGPSMRPEYWGAKTSTCCHASGAKESGAGLRTRWSKRSRSSRPLRGPGEHVPRLRPGATPLYAPAATFPTKEANSEAHPVLRGDAVTVDDGLALYRPKS